LEQESLPLSNYKMNLNASYVNQIGVLGSVSQQV
jgi:hypothetical protein